MNDFDQWLRDRIDIESLTEEMRAALRVQYEAEQQRTAPPAEVIVQVEADGELWPQRVFRCEVPV